MLNGYQASSYVFRKEDPALLDFFLKIRDQVFNKIPFYEAQIEEKKKKITEMIGEFEDIRRRDVYGLIVQEFTELLQKNM